MQREIIGPGGRARPNAVRLTTWIRKSDGTLEGGLHRIKKNNETDSKSG